MPELWHNMQCCQESPLPCCPSLQEAVPCNTACHVSLRYLVLVSQCTRSCAALLEINCGRDWKLHQFQFGTFISTFFPSANCASDLVVWMIPGFLFCFTTEFLYCWESDLIYYSLNTTEKAMQLFLSKGACLSWWHSWLWGWGDGSRYQVPWFSKTFSLSSL